MWTSDFNFAGKLESQLSENGKKTTQNFLFDYGRFSTTWASDPAIAACLGKYIHDVGEAYKKADPDSDGKVIAIGHSMGGLAILYSTGSEFASVTSADHLAGIITLDTPYLGSYQGGFDPFSITNRAGTLMQFGKTVPNGYPPEGSNALYCLAIHHSGESIPPPCDSKIPPELPAGTSLTQIAGSITVKRTLLGAFDYSLPLGNDGVVPVDSQLGYLNMRAKTPTGTGIKVKSDKVECSVTTGDLRQAAASGGVSTLASALLSPLTLFNDYFTLSALGTSSTPTGQDTQRLNTTLVVNGLANLKADCSHSHIYHNQSALNKVTETVKDYQSTAVNDNGSTIGPDSYKGIRLGMKRDAVKQLAAEKSYTAVPQYCDQSTLADGTALQYAKDDTDAVSQIIPPSDDVSTPEGLKIGDPMTKAVELYGPPAMNDSLAPGMRVDAKGTSTGASYSIRGDVPPSPDEGIPYYYGIEALGDAKIDGIVLQNSKSCFN